MINQQSTARLVSPLYLAAGASWPPKLDVRGGGGKGHVAAGIALLQRVMAMRDKTR